MRIYLTLILIITFSTSFSQVGIGTTNPDPSSILELNSSSQGLLTPRMTTALRTAIDSPAEGLIVYDTDESSFYYYSSGTWIPLEGADIRNNYKLVKSVDDLSDELVAGGGSEYLLNTNFLYEINGEITFDFPVNINGAYIEGRDTGSDILVNASGSTFFTGSNGGSLKTLRIEAGGQDLFNINGSGSQSVIAYTLIVNNASSLGTLSNLYAVLFEILQVVNSNDGLTASDMTSFFMDKIFWTDSNSGTFLTLSGAFNNLQIANGRIVSDSGETGIDVSANPTINVSASISQISFDGDGTRVNGYTADTYVGYNFTNDFYVESPGIPVETDDNASGNFYFNGTLTTGFTQNITNGTAVEVQGTGTFASNGLFRFSVSNGGNRLNYEGFKSREFKVNASLSVRVTSAAGNYYAFVIAKNGTIVTESNSVVYIQNDSQIQNVSLNANVNLEKDDYIEVYVQRLTGTGTDLLAVFSENLSIK